MVFMTVVGAGGRRFRKKREEAGGTLHVSSTRAGRDNRPREARCGHVANEHGFSVAVGEEQTRALKSLQ